MTGHERTFWGIESFPVQLRRDFKAECQRVGDTMRERLEYLVARDLRERRQKRKRDGEEL